MISFTINGRPAQLDADPATPLLWALRDGLNMTGTKFGCGVALCGACTVHVDGVAVRACSYPLAATAGRHVTTIEGLSAETANALQAAWVGHQVPQCGYCQPGMIMAAAALLAQVPHPTDAQIDASVTNICRCGTYGRVRAAIHDAAGAQ